MKWWRRGTEPEPAVSDADRQELAQARAELGEQREQLEQRAPEVHALAGYLRRERQENHLADRLRRALEGLG